MTKQVFWTKTIVDTFIEEGNLNERQIYIIKTRALGYTIVKQAEELHLSIDQINKDISDLKKYMMQLKELAKYCQLENVIKHIYLKKSQETDFLFLQFISNIYINLNRYVFCSIR